MGASRGGSGRGTGRRGGRGGIYRYSDSAPPTLGGDDKCPHCLCTPCAVSRSPSFLEGRAAADGRNAHKRYLLYRKFWKVLNELGVWRHEEYLDFFMALATFFVPLHDIKSIHIMFRYISKILPCQVS